MHETGVNGPAKSSKAELTLDSDTQTGLVGACSAPEVQNLPNKTATCSTGFQRYPETHDRIFRMSRYGPKCLVTHRIGRVPTSR